MVFRKILFLCIAWCPFSNFGATPAPVSVRKCNTLYIRESAFFKALEGVSGPQDRRDEQEILQELCDKSSMPWNVMRLAAQKAPSYPRDIKSGVFTNSADFAQTVAACIKDNRIDTQALENKFKLPAFAKLMWSALGAVVGFSCALAYVKYSKR